MIGCRFQIDGNRLRCHGTSFGHGDSDPYLVSSIGDYVVAREKASREWISLGITGSFPATWYLLLVRRESPAVFVVEETIEEIQPGRFWRRAKDTLIEDAKRLHRREEQTGHRGGPNR